MNTFLFTKKRIKVTQAKLVEFDFSSENLKIPPPPHGSIKPKPKPNKRNLIVGTDTPTQIKTALSDDLKLMHKTDPSEFDDGRGIDNEMTKYDG